MWLPVGGLIVPSPRRDWQAPSTRHGWNQDWVVTARCDDGHIVWQGHFTDRDDCDAFLQALVAGSINYQRELWYLPRPYWEPLPDGLIFQLSSQVAITSTSAATQTTTLPGDWNAAINTVEAIAAASGGGTSQQGGSGGGSYAKSVNLNIAASTVVTFQLGPGGTAGASPTAAIDTFFNANTFPASGQAVGAKAGNLGSAGTGGQGGQSASCYIIGTGSVARSGGNGGSFPSGNGAPGGGSAAGSTGTGANGGTTSGAGTTAASGGGGADGGAAGNPNSGNTPGTGGAGANGGGNGGNGGASGVNGGNGTAGTEWLIGATHYGSGGGAGGCGNAAPVGSGSGGLYGGGGTCNGTTGTAAGPGGQGLIILTYTPISSILFVPRKIIFRR